MGQDKFRLFIGKEIIRLQDSFFELPYVKHALKDLREDQIARLNPMVINCCHGDHVAKRPDQAVLYGSSDRTENEIWTIEDRVLSMQPHPELSTHIIQSIITRLHEVKQMTDEQRKELEGLLYDPQYLLVRNIMMKIIFAFLKNQY